MRYLLGLLAIVVFSACGYTFSGSGTILPPDVKKIFIQKAENSTTQFGLADTVTEALQDQFDAYGVITLVDNQSEADAVLRSRILQITRRTRTASSNTNTSVQLETTMKISAELVKASGAVLWRADNMSVSQTFGTDPSVVVASSASFASGALSGGSIANLDAREVARGQEQAVFQALSAQVAQTVYDQAVAPDF